MKSLRCCFAATLLTTLGLCCLTAAAQAYNTAKLAIGFSPYRLGSETTLEVNVNIGNSNGGLPEPVTSFTITMPPKLELIGSSLGLAVCQPGALLQSGLGGCSPNARLGSGSAQVDVPFGPEIIEETASIAAFMGPLVGENTGVLLYAEGKSPVAAQEVFPGVLLVGSGPVGESIDTTLPLTPTLPGAPDASVSRMQLSVGPKGLTYYKEVHGKTVGYRPTGISLPVTCPAGGFAFVAELAFQDDTHLKVPVTVPCPSVTHRRRR